MSTDSRDPIEQLVPDGLYHLATTPEWEVYQDVGFIEPASLVTEGFVHCSWGHQVSGTVARHFAETSELLALLIDPMALREVLLKDEDLYASGQRFPHLYGGISVSAVRHVASIT